MAAVADTVGIEDLYARFSIYGEIFPQNLAVDGKDVSFEEAKSEGLLLPIFSRDPQAIDRDGSGNVLFYSPLSGGGYGRSTSDARHGSYVHCRLSDGSVGYVHRAQLYIPSEKFRKILGTQLVLLAVAFQGMRAQLDKMAAYVAELAELNEKLQALRAAYGACVSTMASISPTDKWGTKPMDPRFAATLVANGVVDPNAKLITHVALNPYILRVYPISNPWTSIRAMEAIYFPAFRNGVLVLEKSLGGKDESDWQNWDWNSKDKPHYCNRAVLDADQKKNKAGSDSYWDSVFTKNKDNSDSFNGDVEKTAKFLSMHGKDIGGVAPPYFAKDGKSLSIVVASQAGKDPNTSGEVYSTHFDGEKVVRNEAKFGEFQIGRGNYVVLWSYLTYGSNKNGCDESRKVTISNFDAQSSAVYMSVKDAVNKGKTVYVPRGEIEAYIDSIRTQVDTQNSAAQIPTNYVSVANNGMQAVLAMSSSLMTEGANVQNQTTRNMSH
jgi:hypothetical protein